MTFKSKVGLELIIPITVILGGLSILFIVKKIWPGLLTILGTAAFIVHLFISTKYTINNTSLQVQSGFFINQTINIKSIRKIVDTRTIISSPALSLDRLEVFYGKFDSIIISPQDKTEFIKKLLAINNQILVQISGNS